MRICPSCGRPKEDHERAKRKRTDPNGGDGSRFCRLELGHEVRVEGGDTETVFDSGKIFRKGPRDEDVIRPVGRADSREYELARRRRENDKPESVHVDENLAIKGTSINRAKRRAMVSDARTTAEKRERRTARIGRGRKLQGIVGTPTTLQGWKRWRTIPDN